MDLSQVQEFKFGKESASDHCLRLVKEADTMLKDLKIKSKSHKANIKMSRLLPNNFINAIETLSTRVKSARFMTPSNFSRPALTRSDNLGPGSYNIDRPFTPQVHSSQSPTVFLNSSKGK